MFRGQVDNLLELELLPIDYSHVNNRIQGLNSSCIIDEAVDYFFKQVVGEASQLSVHWIVKVRRDGYTVVWV